MEAVLIVFTPKEVYSLVNAIWKYTRVRHNTITRPNNSRDGLSLKVHCTREEPRMLCVCVVEETAMFGVVRAHRLNAM